MALSFAQVGDLPFYIEGTRKRVVRDITFDNSYPTGGASVTPSNLGLNYVDHAVAKVASATGGGVNVTSAKYDKATNKILLYDETPAEVANASDMSTTIVRIQAWGF